MLLHEITHALGFSSNSYGDFIDPATGSLIPIDDVKFTSGGKFFLKTPRVLAYLKTHYNCCTMTGMRLEDGGGSGSAGSHWEKTFVDNEYMGASASAEMYVSKLTLSLFHDMGYFIPDYSYGRDLSFGKNMGCSFLEDCSSTSPTTFPDYFCSKSATLPRCDDFG